MFLKFLEIKSHLHHLQPSTNYKILIMNKIIKIKMININLQPSTIIYNHLQVSTKKGVKSTPFKSYDIENVNDNTL